VDVQLRRELCHLHAVGPGTEEQELVLRADLFTGVSPDQLDAMVETLAVALELREDETGRHTRRVTELALALTADVATELADDPELRYGFLLHDLGKIGVSERILLKPGGLTRLEVREIERHPVLGAEIATGASLLTGVARDVIAFHHECWDGSGYPWGLKAEQIPLAARIFAVADAFEAMTSDRPYRNALPTHRALCRLRGQAGHQFDPGLVIRFEQIIRETVEPELDAPPPLHLTAA
jgi:HD-GYP domain-containing protein (c-di-GMP phosphodiesterase class II)